MSSSSSSSLSASLCAFSCDSISSLDPSSIIQVSLAIRTDCIFGPALYLVLKLRHHRTVLRPLGWVWPRAVYAACCADRGHVTGLRCCLLFAAIAIESTPQIAYLELLLLAFSLGPILEESFLSGMSAPSNRSGHRQRPCRDSHRIIVCAPSPAGRFGSLGIVYCDRASYGWMRMASGSTAAARSCMRLTIWPCFSARCFSSQ